MDYVAKITPNNLFDLIKCTRETENNCANSSLYLNYLLIYILKKLINFLNKNKIKKMSTNIKSKLKEISEIKYKNIHNIILVCNIIAEYDDYIYNHINEELYERLEIEFETCYKELKFNNNNEYLERIYNNCINVIREVLTVLF